MLTPATMGGAKPIETAYKGCRFRSRLEARWAVFFDAMGCPWEYEPEGFVLPGGLCYLPDFHIDPEPERIPGGIWVEVKGQMTPDDKKKISLFSKEHKTIVLRDVPENYQEFFQKYTNIPPKDWSRVALWQRRLINKALHEARGARFEHNRRIKKAAAARSFCEICGKPLTRKNTYAITTGDPFDETVFLPDRVTFRLACFECARRASESDNDVTIIQAE